MSKERFSLSFREDHYLMLDNDREVTPCLWYEALEFIISLSHRGFKSSSEKLNSLLEDYQRREVAIERDELNGNYLAREEHGIDFLEREIIELVDSEVNIDFTK